MRTNLDVYNRDEALIHLKKHGLKSKHLELWVTKFRNMRNAAPRRGIECLLTLSQYVKLAIKGGITHPNQIGCRSNQMARFGDTGNYEWGNCRVIIMTDNQRERTENGGTAAGARKRTGRTKATHLYVKTIAEKISKSFIVVSPSGKEFKGTNLKKFAEKHNLSQSALSMVCRGKHPHHKGWTGRYLEK